MCEDRGITIIPSWHQYLPKDSTCHIDMKRFQFPNDIAPIALAIVEILLRIGTLAAVAFVIYGGFQFLTSQGEPDKAANARKTLINAVVGLVITVIATAVVAFVGRQLL